MLDEKNRCQQSCSRLHLQPLLTLAVPIVQHPMLQSPNSQPSGSQPSDSQSLDLQSSDLLLTDTQPSDRRPSDQRPSGQRPSGQRPSGQRPSGQRPSGQESSVSASRAAEFGSRLHREERLVPAFGTWQPYYNEQGQPDRNGHRVKLILLQLPDQRGWRVCLWGADGVGMERDYPEGEREQAREMWRTIDTRCLITRPNLLKIGFRDA